MLFIVSKDGMIIDHERTYVIAKIIVPSLNEAMQSLIGRINLVRSFVPNFTQTVRPLKYLIKKTYSLSGMTLKSMLWSILGKLLHILMH